MHQYNFTTVNDKDFEALTCDLIGAHLGTTIERFKKGKDKGVDGRFFANDGPDEVILQSKHYVGSGYDKLLSQLPDEVAKVERLKPIRYLLATSVPLSREQKSKIVALFGGWIKREDDVFGQEDLNDILARNPSIERRFYSLWMTSPVVLERILHSGIYGRSQYQEQEIREKSQWFVATKDLPLAGKMLDEKRVVIITGAPGLGKTTLAEILSLQYISDGYEFIKISQDIAEGEKVFGGPNDKRIFLFDDFLGRNLRDSLEFKDSAVVNFIKRVRSEKNKRFLLTSRTNILNQGKHLCDLFVLNKVDRDEYEIKIERLDVIDKARILYNHLYHSGLSDDIIEEIYTDRRYRTIINHRNFTPRLVSILVDAEKANSFPKGQYFAYIERVLKNPEIIWEHCWRAQIDQACRDLVSLVGYNGRGISEDELRGAFFRYRATGHPRTASENATDFNNACAICTGSLLNRSITESGVRYDLFSPSIGDLLLGAVFSFETARSFICALSTTGALSHLTAIGWAKKITHAQGQQILATCAINIPPEATSDYRATLVCALPFSSFDSEETKTKLSLLEQVDVSALTKDGYRSFVNVLETVINYYDDSPSVKSLIERLVDDLKVRVLDAEEFKPLFEFVSGTHNDAIKSVVKPLAVDKFVAHWKQNVKAHMEEKSIAESIVDPSDSQAIVEAMIAEMRSIISDYAYGDDNFIEESAIVDIISACDTAAIIENNIRRRSDEGTAFDMERWAQQQRKKQQDIEDQIDDLFQRPGK